MGGRWTGLTPLTARPPARSGALTRAHSAALSGALTRAPGDVADEIEQLHGDVAQLGQELIDYLFSDPVSDAPKPGTPGAMVTWYHAVWRPFVNRWLSFRSEHRDASFGASFWQNLPLSGAWDHLQDFRQELGALRDQAIRLKIPTLAPPPRAPRRDPDLDPQGILKVVAYGALGLGGLLLALKVLDRPKTPPAWGG